MSLVKVWTDIGARKPVALFAKIVSHAPKYMSIRYLSKGPDKLWRYEEDTYEIDSDSIAEWLGTDFETDVGFIQGPGDAFEKCRSDADSDYVPNMSDEESSDDEEFDEEDDTDEDDGNEEEFENEFEEEEEEEEESLED